MKRVGNDAAVCKRERCEQLSVDFGKQDGLRRRARAVELGQPRERLLIVGAAESKGHAPFARMGRSRLSSPPRQATSVGRSAKVVRSRSREVVVEVGGNHASSFE